MAKSPAIVKSRTKAKLVAISIVSAIAMYLYFSYSRTIFPFTEENKAKLDGLLKGKKKDDVTEGERSIEDILAEEGEGNVDPFGNVNQPRGGTGLIDLTSRDLGGPLVKGDEDMMNLYNQELYRQLYMPYEDLYDQNGNKVSSSEIIRGGDVPGDDNGADPYTPWPNYYYPPSFPTDLLNCHQCPEGTSWDTCVCQCLPLDAARPQCFRAECICPPVGDELEDLDPSDIEGIASEIERLERIRKSLLDDVRDLKELLDKQVHKLERALADEEEARRKLEDLLDEINNALEEEQINPPPIEEKIRRDRHRSEAIAEAQAGEASAIASVNGAQASVSTTQTKISSVTDYYYSIRDRVNSAYATASTGSRSGTYSYAGGGTAYASAGGTTAIANIAKVRAAREKVRQYRAYSAGKVLVSSEEQQYAFSKLGRKGRRMKRMKNKPTNFLKNKQLFNVLPPIVKKRHMGSKATLA